MTDVQHKLTVLRKVGEKLNEANITWAVGASLLLYFKGITDKFNDIDIMVTEEDVSRLREIMLSLGTMNPPNPNVQYKTRHFLEFVVDSVDVDVMAGFVIVDADEEYDCSLQEDQIIEYYMLDGVSVPLQSVPLWRRYYSLMHRVGKVKMIDRAVSGREYFMQTAKIGFSVWNKDDTPLAELLWGNSEVTRFICASGCFSAEEIAARLETEIGNQVKYSVQYWPIFRLDTGELIGCCGLRPYSENRYEIGFHLRPKFWGRGYAVEAARAVIEYAFSVLQAEGLFAGHNPQNTASAKVLKKLGFRYTGDEFYAPTGLYHPSYEMIRE